MFDLSDVRYIKRLVVGSDHPAQLRTQAEVEAQTALLNQCLTGTPKGVVIGIEKSFTLFQIGEHQVVLQWIAYHIGFPRKPVWISD